MHTFSQLLIRFALVYAAFCIASVAHAQMAGPALTVDVAADRHPISSDIYGMAYPDAALATEIRLPMNRLGGDATTRYNWKIDSSNVGADWFFIAGSDNPQPTPSGGPDAVVAQSKSIGGKALLTVPIIDFINSATTTDCSFPVSLFGPQQQTNPYVHPIINGEQTDAGNGLTPDGQPIQLTPQQILRTNLPNTPDFQRGWIEHLVKKFGTTAQGGVGVYELDNEPGGWNNTHRDVHPGLTGHDELVSRSIAYAAMIKSVDPSALVDGPGDFVMHYQNDGKPGDGSKEHGGLGQASYYLQQMRSYEKQHGTRLLDYFDEHYYPMDQDNQTADTTLECTRSLWDPAYIEQNWYGKSFGAKEIIPKFHRWVDQYYPGTKIAISEYGCGNDKTLIGALAEADMLGIFARERVDLACLFGPPKANEPIANAFRIYLNYDGHGSRFGDVWIKSASEDQGRLSIYGAQRSSDHTLTLIVINKSHDDLTSNLSLAHFDPAPAAKVFRYSSAALDAVIPQADQPVTAAGFSATFPAQSITLFMIPPR